MTWLICVFHSFRTRWGSKNWLRTTGDHRSFLGVSMTEVDRNYTEVTLTSPNPLPLLKYDSQNQLVKSIGKISDELLWPLRDGDMVLDLFFKRTQVLFNVSVVNSGLSWGKQRFYTYYKISIMKSREITFHVFIYCPYYINLFLECS